MLKFELTILACFVAALASCAKPLGADASQPNKNRPLSADAIKRYSGMSDAELIIRAQQGNLGKCQIQDVSAKKAECQSGPTYSVFIADSGQYFPSGTSDPGESAVCRESLGASLRSAVNAGVCYSQGKLNQ